jgi:hypothetical protein
MQIDLCCFCKEDLNKDNRVTFNNARGTELLSPQTFTYMEKGESSHMECYIRECFRLFCQEEKDKFNRLLCGKPMPDGIKRIFEDAPKKELNDQASWINLPYTE